VETKKQEEKTTGEDELWFILCDASPYMAIITDKTFRPVYCNTAVIDYFKLSSRTEALERIFPLLEKAMPEYQSMKRKSYPIHDRLQFAIRKDYYEYTTEFVFDGKFIPMRIIEPVPKPVNNKRFVHPLKAIINGRSIHPLPVSSGVLAPAKKES
jgi:PAS domain-containing protein